MKRNKILKSLVESRPYEKWNSMLELIANTEIDDMTQIQKNIAFCLRYDSEVHNGGHIQYFTNFKATYLHETLIALVEIGAINQMEILQSFTNLNNDLELEDISTKEEFISKVLVGYDYTFIDEKKEDLFEQYILKWDNKYYECNPSVIDLLEKYFQENEQEFIEIIDN